ncbi:hypothetical protein AB1Y20_021400 [Prymnesium parvum]|uniref:oligopeptidase A n=1 Tax=Prymnesium parvum TaxID=97485 RepID=A0AB34JI59_PRYPA
MQLRVFSSLLACHVAPVRAFLVSAGPPRTRAGLRMRGGASMVATSVNPLLDQTGLPRFDVIEPADVKPALTEVLQQLQSDFEALESKLEATEATALTYSDVVESLEKLESPVEYAWGVVGHLMGVKNGDELREAHREMQPSVIQTTTKLSQSYAVYRALEAIQKNDQSLDAAQKRILAASLLSMKLSGVALEGEKKERYNANRMELAELATKFSNNLLDATKSWSLTLTDPAQVKGLPPSVLEAAAARAAADGGKPSATAGPWKLGLDIPSYLPAMKNLEDRELRKKLYTAFVTRAGEENAPLLRRILSLRKQQAQILGYNTYAEVSMERKMARSVAEVDELHNMLAAKARPAAAKEIEQLTDFAKAHGFDGDKLELWDVAYWSERQSEKLFEFEEEELKPYFALPNVLAGLFGLCERIFDVTIKESEGGEPKWHPDVQFFHVNDKSSGEHMASFYLDPYARPENKNGGAWMGVCQGKSKVLNKKPVAYLTCNGSPPTDGKPSLMTFNEVTTLFHETGHGLQHMLTQVPHAPAAGISGVEWDAVELPSQFMENWCYDEKTIYGAGLAKHYKTGEPLPRNLFDKLCEQKTYQAGMGMLRQLYFGSMDIELHHRYDPDDESRSPFDVQRDLAQTLTVLPPLPEDRFLCSFSHIFAGGYAAGYYSYKWAEVLSADAFAAFEEVGLENEDEVRAVGRKFRDTVLSLGGGAHPSEVFREFRGRDPSPDALLTHNGLASA